MSPMMPYAYAELEFGRDGTLLNAAQVAALHELIGTEQATDLCLISHGWNNDMAEARDLYTRLFDRVGAEAAAYGSLGVRTVVVAGVLWPSKRFADASLIPGGAAAVGDDTAADRIIRDQIGTLVDFLPPGPGREEVAAAHDLVSSLSDDPDAQVRFAEILLKALPSNTDEEGDPHIPGEERYAMVGASTLLEKLGRPAPVMAPVSGGCGVAALDDEAETLPEPQGGSAGIGDLFSGIKAGAMNLMNYVTYYQMKARAGLVGGSGGNPILRDLRRRFPELKLHLIGHSFGARVITSMVAGPEPRLTAAVDSVSLLQAAFSHFGFADNFDDRGTPGFFRRLVADRLVSGPLLITHTRNDRAVGIAYAIASRVAGQIAAAVGDAKDPYGGLGSNGAQQTPEARTGKLLASGSAYPALEAGAVYNLEGDGRIKSHSDVANDAVAHVLVSAIAAT